MCAVSMTTPGPIVEDTVTDLRYFPFALVESVVKAKPSAAKGKYLKSVTVSSTMGPGVTIDTAHIDERVKH